MKGIPMSLQNFMLPLAFCPVVSVTAFLSLLFPDPLDFLFFLIVLGAYEIPYMRSVLVQPFENALFGLAFQRFVFIFGRRIKIDVSIQFEPGTKEEHEDRRIGGDPLTDRLQFKDRVV